MLTKNPDSNSNATIGCLLGTAIGDARGLSHEGLTPSQAKRLFPHQSDYYFIGNKGMVSDDTEQTCMVAQALIAAQGNVTQFQTVLAWKLRFWLLGLPAGIGFATLRAILKLWVGFTPKNSGVFSAGNGAAMRSAILGVCYGHDTAKMQQFVRANTRLTHTDPKAEWGALAVALAAYLSSQQLTVSPAIYLEKLQSLLNTEPAAATFVFLMQETIKSIQTNESTSQFIKKLGLELGISGYVYHTVPVVIHIWLRHQTDYRTAITEIIACGGDTDTTAAILGGIIGANVGKSGIPQNWLENLWEYPRNIAWMEELGRRLYKVCYGEKQAMLSISIITVLLRNLLFITVVLLHGLRRLILLI